MWRELHEAGLRPDAAACLTYAEAMRDANRPDDVAAAVREAEAVDGAVSAELVRRASSLHAPANG